MPQTAPFPIIDGKYQMEREPIVRIGIVLEEDGKSRLTLKVPSRGYQWATDDAAMGAEPEGYKVEIDGETRLTLRDGADREIVGKTPMLRLLPPAGARATKPGDGVLVRDIVAGRGFHWQKMIDQTLPDVLEFRAIGGKLVLVNELPIETYLIGVITGEMSAECPIEFMKAQAIAARSWLLGQPVAPHPDKPYLWCNDDCCQRYQGTGGWSDQAIRAIQECRGEVLITASNHYCDARYSKNTGGISEDATSVWRTAIEGLDSRIDAPEDSPVNRFFPVTEANVVEYLTGDWLEKCDAFASPTVVPEDTITKYLGRVDEPGTYFRWTLTLTHAQMREALIKRGGATDVKEILEVIPGRRGRSGRLESVDVVYTSESGGERRHTLAPEYRIRAGLSMSFLYSSAFIVELDRDARGVVQRAVLRGGGWGHGAGLCQIGGLGRALKGQDYRTILAAYYSNVRLESIYR